MRVSHDSEVGALYISFVDTTVTTEQVAEGIAVGYADDGRIAGIGIPDASEWLECSGVWTPDGPADVVS